MCDITLLQVGEQSTLEESTSSKVTEIEDIAYSSNIHVSANTQEPFLPNEPECHSCTKLKAKVVKLQKKVSYLTKRQQELISRTEKVRNTLFCLHLETPLALFTFNLLHIFLAGKFSIYIQYNKIDYGLHCLIYSAEQLITKLY